MSSVINTPGMNVSPSITNRSGIAAGGLRFDWIMVFLGLLFVGGLYLDGWAHNHGKTDESFFTIWHAFFYSGFGLVALMLTGTLVLNRLRGKAWHAALPAGYQLSLIGVIVFAAGGVGDMVWHELFGVEQDFDALFSPSHLALGIGLCLVVSGPLRAAWQRASSTGNWRSLGPGLLSLTSLLSVLTFFMMGAYPLTTTVAAADHSRYATEAGQIAGTLGILITAALLTGTILLALYRWQLPPGTLTLVWGINAVAMAIVNWHHDYAIFHLGALLLATVLADLLLYRMRPGLDNPGALRLFAFSAPFLFFAGYFTVLLLTVGTPWTIHLWTGAVVLSGVVGWLLSYLLLPPALPAVEPQQ